ncbi:transcriptional regulator [Alkalilimnicola ehrlichii]|uniref:Transcriptional regulator n=1 Tax=Alkalilimnicola ehrlichii TaxID=351052 RepID=A0A3E0WJM8_9GAMM|nr:transcriptional regulator HexR [Alkalilimnicola ehrlichii]RFA25300.1 transcriptional regulator [Alkalilimnicola ehrlichii]RFA32413.1 transcriptional regulator [Alkalilimnicola ehrlichii]
MLARIESLRPELRRSEQKVADLVLERPNAVINAPLATIAEEAGVSEPTVIRFCRAVGCSGFQDFKLHLAGSLASGAPYIYSGVSATDKPADLAAKVFDRSISTLMQVRNHLNIDAVEKAVDTLAAASRVEFYGHGASGIVAMDAQHKFFRMGIPTVAYNDPHTHGMAATILQPGSVVVAISHTGRTRDLLRSAELALEAGAKVISITACGSPLANISTIALYADVTEDTDVYTPMTSRMAHLAITDVLAVGVALKRGPELAAQLEKSKRNLQEKRLRDGTLISTKRQEG